MHSRILKHDSTENVHSLAHSGAHERNKQTNYYNERLHPLRGGEQKAVTGEDVKKKNIWQLRNAISTGAQAERSAVITVFLLFFFGSAIEKAGGCSGFRAAALRHHRVAWPISSPQAGV